MRLLSSMSAAVLLAVLALAACNSSDNSGNKAVGSSNNSAATVASATPGRAASSDGIKRITTIETRNAVEKGEAIIVDVRGDAAYKQTHIKGSISIPLGDVAARVNELPRDKMIVTYCS